MKIRTPTLSLRARDVAEAQLIHIRERSRMRERFYLPVSASSLVCLMVSISRVRQGTGCGTPKEPVP